MNKYKYYTLWLKWVGKDGCVWEPHITVMKQKFPCESPRSFLTYYVENSFVNNWVGVAEDIKDYFRILPFGKKPKGKISRLPNNTRK